MRDVGLCAQVACIWEATARKAGNVHRFSDFEDSCYLDFLLSAAAIAPVLARAGQQRVGVTVLEAVRATRRVTKTNANLGIVLLLAPLAAVPLEQPLQTGVARILDGLDVEDARLVYEAIRSASPGGLGNAEEQDVRSEPTQTLRQVMSLAANRDLIARQYATGFVEVLEDGVPVLMKELKQNRSLEDSIVRVHLYLMGKYPDTLIVRKRGRAEANESAHRAKAVLETEMNGFSDFDAWLRSEAHGRNPGATADLVAAILFVALRDDLIPLPLQIAF